MDEEKVMSLAGAFSAAATCVIVALELEQRDKDKQRGRQAKLTRNALQHPRSSIQMTAWKRLLLSGSDTDFVATLRLPRRLIADKLLPLFRAESSSSS